jgi:hypothetical protein
VLIEIHDWEKNEEKAFYSCISLSGGKNLLGVRVVQLEAWPNEHIIR